MQNQWNVSSRKLDWSLLSADSIFKGESQEELRRDIALLTVAARGHICGEPKPAVRKDVSPKERLESRLLLHVATLLSTAGSSTVVSGFLEPDNVVIVCARDERPASVNGPAPEMPKIERVVADVEASKRLVDNWYRQPVEREPDLDERLRELCAIMAFYIRTPPEDRRSSDVAKWCFSLDALLIRRVHRKLAARVAMMDPQPSRKKFWDEPPLRTMREWYIRNPAKSWGTEYVELAGEPDVLAKHQLTPDGPHKYPLSFQNAGQWLGALEDLLGTIQRGLSGKHTTPQTRRKVPSPRETVDILIAIRDLDFLLRSNLFELLNQHGVGRCLLPPVQRPEDVFQNDDSSERDGQPFEEDHDETEDASLERCPEESRVQHLHRYLQSITTWYTSRRILMSGFKAPARDVMVFQVKANPSIQVTYEDVKTMTDAYMARLRQHYSSDEVGRATHFLATKGFICKNPDPPAEEKQMMSAKLTEQMAVHAEASMLALVWTARYGSSEEQCGQNLLETYFPNSKNIVLGSSKKCCACCSMLSERLARLHQPDFWRPAPQDTPSFILPGTHAAISPWIPPASGIPTAILKDMRASLFYIFHDLVSTGGEGYMPPVSAPDDEQPKDEDDDEEDDDYYMHALGSLSPCLDDVNSSSTTPTAGG